MQPIRGSSTNYALSIHPACSWTFLSRHLLNPVWRYWFRKSIQVYDGNRSLASDTKTKMALSGSIPGDTVRFKYGKALKNVNIIGIFR
jgi:hypothetical protein